MDNKILSSRESNAIDRSCQPPKKRKLGYCNVPEPASDFHLPRESSPAKSSQHEGQPQPIMTSYGLDSRDLSVYPEDKQEENERSIQPEVLRPVVGVSADNISQRGGRGRIGCKLSESQPADKENRHDFLTEKVSTIPQRSLSSDSHNWSSDMSRKPDGNRLPCGESASIGFEKIWDGSLQLNSSITVSAVAFFKSGERLVDINWSNFVEVKGKVRLDVFQKYIQDLPRSRTRGLMVISVEAKEGSSVKEVKGMMEFINTYKKREIVGYATLSSEGGGGDLYICPRSDEIYTLLANYGIPKGTSAAQDKPDSFIGCVVWRKNDTAAKSSANAKQHLNNSPSNQSHKSQSGSSIAPAQQQTGETNMPLSAAATAQSMIINVGDHKPGIGKSSGQTTPFKGQTSSAAFPGYDNPRASLGVLPNTSVSFQANSMNQTALTADDDDDLPEYDFGRSLSMPSDVSVAAGGGAQTERGMLAAVSAAANSIMVDFGNPRPSLSSNFHQGLTPYQHGSVVGRDPQFHVSGKLEGQRGLQNYATPAASSPKSRSEMAEWLPLQPQPSNAMPSASWSLTLQNQQVPGTRPPLQSPSLSYFQLPPPPPMRFPPPLPPPPPMRSQNNPRPMTRFQAFQHHSVLRPPYGSFGGNHP